MSEIIAFRGQNWGGTKGSTKPAKMTWPFMSNAIKSRAKPGL
jgi:hypothetical protein